MAFDTYANLRTTVAKRLGNRTDLVASGEVDEFIDAFETEANTFLKHHRKEASTTLTINSSGKASLPADFLEVRSAEWTGSPNVELVPISVGGANRMSPYDTTGTPTKYHITGGSTAQTFAITPPSSGTVTLIYDQKVPALSATAGSTTNWLLTLAPNAYLYGTLRHGHLYSRNYEDAQANGALAAEILEGIADQSQLAAFKNAEIALEGLSNDDYNVS